MAPFCTESESESVRERERERESCDCWREIERDRGGYEGGEGKLEVSGVGPKRSLLGHVGFGFLVHGWAGFYVNIA